MKLAIVLLCFLLAACGPKYWYRYVSVQSQEPGGKSGPGRMILGDKPVRLDQRYPLNIWVEGRSFSGTANEPKSFSIPDEMVSKNVNLLALGVSEQSLSNSNGNAFLIADDLTEMKCIYSVDDDNNATGVCGTSDGKLYDLQMRYGGAYSPEEKPE